MTDEVLPRRITRAVTVEEMETRKLKSRNQNIDALLLDDDTEPPKEFFGAASNLGPAGSDNEPVNASAAKVQIRFGVVGEGKDRRILGYGSSTALDSSTEIVPWVCPKCSFENPDGNDRKCGMCGFITGHSRKGRRSSLVFGLQAMPSVAEGQSFEESFSEKMAFRARNRNSIVIGANGFITSTAEGAEEDGETHETQEDHGKDNLIMSFANWSVSDSGGWVCPSCTYLNLNSMHLTCAVCESPRPAKSHQADMNRYGSVAEFLTASFNRQDGDVDDEVEKQLNAYAEFEQMVIEKERMEEMLDFQKEHLAEIQESAVTQRAANTQSESTAVVSEVKQALAASAKRLREVEEIYTTEKREFVAMENLQRQKAVEIESVEGVNPREVMENRVQRPGAQCISSATLAWIGQQRMLNDWRRQLAEKQDEIMFLRQTHEACRQSVGMNGETF